MGLRQVRIGHHGGLARTVTDEGGFKILMDRTRRETNASFVLQRVETL